MAASYPTAIKTFTQQVDGVDWVLAQDINDAYDEIEAIQTELGTQPSGSMADVKTRLAVSLDDDGTLKLTAITEHTGIADNNIVEVDGTPNAAEITVWTANGIDGKTYDELIALLRAAGDIGIDNDDLLEVDGTPNSGEICRFTANGIEGRTDAEMKTQLGYMTDLVDDTTPTLGGDAAGGGYGWTGLDVVNIAQSADGDAIEIAGYDDMSAEFLKLFLASNGVAYIQASQKLRLQTADDIYVRLGDNAGAKTFEIVDSDDVIQWKADSDGKVTHTGTLDMNSQDIDNVKAVTFIAEVDNGNSSTADTIDWGAGQKQKSTMTGDCTYTFTAPDGPGNFVLKLVQDGTGSRNPTWPASVKWEGGAEPAWSTAANAVDIITFYYDGTNYYGSAGIGYA